MKAILLITFSLDGNMWCALVGDNLQDGLAGFGQSPMEAMRELACGIEKCNWNTDGITLW